MGIRIQPLDIEISKDPKKDPFENDKLGRREVAEILTHLVGNIDSACTLAVDAPWGAGKTTFLRLWGQHLRNEGFTVVQYNAWETDFCEDPFVALCAELTTAFDTVEENALGKERARFSEAAQKVIQHVAWNAVSHVVSHATVGLVSITKLKAEIATDLSPVEERLAKYRQAKTVVSDFKDSLENIADALSDQKGPKRHLIIMIDELDRCRPSYAVELLEVAKHLFSVNKVVFVLAVNREQLAHSVSALYGDAFDAKGYLRRFFNVDVRLPVPDREAFIMDLLAAIQIEDYLKRTDDSYTTTVINSNYELLIKFLGIPNLSLRDAAQAIHRLGVVFALLPNDKLSFLTAAVGAIILRTINENLYRDFVDGNVSDLGVVDGLFKDVDMKALQQTDEGRLFEAVLIMAYKEMKSMSSHPPNICKHVTPLEERYKGEQSENTAAGEEHHDEVLFYVEHQKNIFIKHNDRRLGFMSAVKRLELLDKDLISEEPK